MDSLSFAFPTKIRSDFKLTTIPIPGRNHSIMKRKPKSGLWARIRRVCLKLGLFVFLFTLCQVAALKYIRPIVTPNVAWEWIESVYKKDRTKRPVYVYKKIEDISPHLQKAVLAAEDQRFASHSGFDFNEISNAVRELIRHKRLRGASTISMQTARSVFWISSRSLARKIIEIYYTVLIELMWDKKRILEIYLNTVDWGTGITGAEAAAQKYFSTRAADLNASQAALLAAVLPNPHRLSPVRPSRYVQKRQHQIMADMKKMPLL